QRSFVIMTFFIPALMFGVTVLPTLFANRGSNEVKRMVVVATDRGTAEMIRTQIEEQQESSKKPETSSTKKFTRSLPQTNFAVEVRNGRVEGGRGGLVEKVKQKELDGFLWATRDAIAAHKLDFVTPNVSSFIDNGVLGQVVTDALRRESLKSKGLKDEDIEAVLAPITVNPQSPMGKNAPDLQTMFI